MVSMDEGTERFERRDSAQKLGPDHRVRAELSGFLAREGLRLEEESIRDREKADVVDLPRTADPIRVRGGHSGLGREGERQRGHSFRVSGRRLITLLVNVHEPDEEAADFGRFGAQERDIAQQPQTSPQEGARGRPGERVVGPGAERRIGRVEILRVMKSQNVGGPPLRALIPGPEELQSGTGIAEK